MIKYWHQPLSNISPKAQIGDGTVIHAGVHIHDDVYIGQNCQIEAMVFIPNGVHIASDVFIGPQVCFTNDPGMKESRDTWKPVQTIVEAHVKIGAGALIRAGVTIGAGAKIGMGAVVLENVPSGETWVGNPAHRIVK